MKSLETGPYALPNPDHKKLRWLIIKHEGNVENIAKDPEVKVTKRTISLVINGIPELKKLAEQQRNKRIERNISQIKSTEDLERSLRRGKRKKIKPVNNPGKAILEALIINYEGDLEKMTGNINIRTKLKTLQSWIDEEGLYEFVEQQKRGRQGRETKSSIAA